MIQQLFISGQLATGIYRDDTQRYFVFGTSDQSDPREARAGEVEFLLSLNAEFKELPSQSAIADVRMQLEDEEEKSTALFLVLSGLDQALTKETRNEAQTVAEELLADPKILRFVRNRLLSRPVPAGLASAPPYNVANPILSSIYLELFDNQPAIEELIDCWDQILSQFFPTTNLRATANQAIVDSGFLADVAQAITANKNVRINELVVMYSLDGELRAKIAQIPHILNAFRSRLAATVSRAEYRNLPASKALNQDAQAQEDEYTYLIFHTTPFDSYRRRRLSAFESITAIKKQISAIRELLFSGNVPLAQKYLKELLTFNLAHGDREHLGKTLCNLSTIALEANELEMAESLADNALLLRIENDPVIYATHAEVLRWSGRFPKALEEYAYIKEQFPHVHYGFCAYAEVLKDMGRFQEALTAYEDAAKRFPYDPVPGNGRAGVLLAMGKAEDACMELSILVRHFDDLVSRTQYVNALSIVGKLGTALAVAKRTKETYPRDVSGYWSAARTMRRAWMLDQALAAYQEINEKFPELPVGLCGKAAVFKRMGKLKEALEIYERVLEEFHNNPEARRGKISVSILLGANEVISTEIRHARLMSESDWREHYLVSLAYLQAGELDEAISRMTLGYHKTPWQYVRVRYATGLGVAILKKKKATDAVPILKSDMALLDFGRKQQRSAILSHAYAEAGDSVAARFWLQKASGTQDQILKDLVNALSVSYSLIPPKVSQNPISNIGAQIQSTELFMAVHA